MITYEADEKNVRDVIQALGLDGQWKGLGAAIIESDVRGPEADE